MFLTKARCQNSEGRETKKHDTGQFFSFANLSNFRKLRNTFWYQLK